MNLEEILRLGDEPSHKRLPLASQTTGQRVGWLVASVACIDALEWAKRAVDEEASFSQLMLVWGYTLG